MLRPLIVILMLSLIAGGAQAQEDPAVSGPPRLGSSGPTVPAPLPVIELTNGDKITGTIVEETPEHLILEHALLGRITIPGQNIKTITRPAGSESTPPQKVTSGATPGAAPGATPGASTATAATAGAGGGGGAEATAQVSDVRAAVEHQAPDAQAVEQATELLTDKGYGVTPPAEAEPEDQGLILGPFTLLKGWERRFELGINGSEGNSENYNIRAALGGFYEDPRTRWIFNTVYYGAGDGGKTTENNLFAEFTRDSLHPDEPYFYFITARYDWDAFKDWDHRINGSAGMGYQLVKEETVDLLGRIGAGGNQQWGGTEDGFTPEGLLGLDFKWKINGRQNLFFSNSLYPNLSDLGEFRNLTVFEWTTKLDLAKSLALKIGLSNEYDSLPGAGDSANDFKYYLALVFDF